MYKVLQQEVPTKDAKASEVLWVESHKGQEVLAVQLPAFIFSALSCSLWPTDIISLVQLQITYFFNYSCLLKNASGARVTRF